MNESDDDLSDRPEDTEGSMDTQPITTTDRAGRNHRH
jgi:hypothetical protein